MALIATTPASRAGIDASNGAAASAGGDYFVNTGKEVFAIFTAGGPIDVTFEAQVDVSGIPLDDLVVTVNDNVGTIIGPFPLATFGETVNISYTGVTTTSVMVVQVTPGA